MGVGHTLGRLSLGNSETVSASSSLVCLSLSLTHTQSHTRFQGIGDLPEPQQDHWQDALSSGLLCSPGNFKAWLHPLHKVKGLSCLQCILGFLLLLKLALPLPEVVSTVTQLLERLINADTPWGLELLHG